MDSALDGQNWSDDDLQQVLEWPDKKLDELIEAAYEVRKTHFGHDVQLKYLMNAKSGLCPEDCNYCSQSSVAESEIEQYSWRSEEELLKGAKEASELNANRYCIVASGRGPSEDEIDYLVEAVPKIKEQYELKICLCLGLLKRDQAFRLSEAGVDIINHNLNTSKDYYGEICTTHDFEDRVRTLEYVKEAGMTVCSGGIVGMGETRDDVINLVKSLREQQPKIVPINFLIPIQGTPLEDEGELTTEFCLKALCLARFMLPDRDLTISAGREWHLGPAQKDALKIGSSLFIGGYLTTKGEEVREDLDM
ncbi:MAG: biotin synthase BioB, partial [bacterium]